MAIVLLLELGVSIVGVLSVAMDAGARLWLSPHILAGVGRLETGSA
jgi:hypothetical protein